MIKIKPRLKMPPITPIKLKVDFGGWTNYSFTSGEDLVRELEEAIARINWRSGRNANQTR